MPSYVDALVALTNGLPNARWNFEEAIGSQIANPAGLGSPATVTYSFMIASPAYYGAGIAGIGDPADSFQPLDAAQRDGAQRALDAWAAVANLTFIEVPDTGAGGLIRFGSFDFTQGAAFAYYPGYGYTLNNRGIILTATPQDIAGDVWLSTSPLARNGDLAPGQYGFATLLHEIGHALGLKHPFQGSALLTGEEDSRSYTVMSYTAPDNVGTAEVTGDASFYSWTISNLSPRTPMLYDVAAIQYLYGANTAYNAGDTTYDWALNERFLETIWDGGGIDTIDAGNQILPSIIDLNAGSFSSIGMRLTEADRRLEIPSWATAVPTPSYDGKDNLAIAYGAAIENATGGAGNDQLIGNALDNRLAGGAGDDVLTGGPGNDILDGGSGVEIARFDGPQSRFTIAAAPGGGLLVTDKDGTLGTDTLFNIEQLGFADGIIAAPSALLPLLPQATPGSASITLGSGPDSLVLQMNQDAYQGSAQYTVSVDGVQIGGIQTAVALRSAGLYDTVTLLGDWSGGEHSLTVNFLNDAWDGTAATDRNLYVAGVTYNGVTQPGGSAALMSEGPQFFGFTGAAGMRMSDIHYA